MRLHKLTAAFVGSIKTPGLHADGGNLVLRVDNRLNKSWGFRYAIGGKDTMMGLGAYPTVSLVEARGKALALRKVLTDGRNPLIERDTARAAERMAATRLITVEDAASRFIVDRNGASRNAQHRADVCNSFTLHINPVIGTLPIADIDTPAILKVLERDNFWREKPQTANRVRARIEQLIDWAVVRTYRQRGENPARWKGHLDQILLAPTKLAPVKNHPALPWQEVPQFMADLRAREGINARTLEFAILNTSRISEVLEAPWSEFDLSNALWTIPAQRMKAQRDHVVPLSPRALEILRGLPRTGERVFARDRFVVRDFLKKTMRRRDITIHGFRASFSTWCAEATRFERDVREACLAHRIKDATEAAYQRGTMLSKRAVLMHAWAAYCAAPATDADTVVVPIAAAR